MTTDAAWGKQVVGATEAEENQSVAPVSPAVIDINTMSTQDFLALADWQWTTVLTQILAELGAVQRKRAELSPYYYEYKGLQERERNLAQMKSAAQSILRTQREV